MTVDQYNNIEKKKLNKRIEILENLLIHSKNKFLNLMSNVDNSGFRMIEHMIRLIDEEVVQNNIPCEPNSKFNNYIKNKISKG